MASESYDIAGAERARRFTRYYHELQGYTLVPWALPMVLFWGSEAGVLRGDWWLWAFVASLLAAGVATWSIGRWYARNYGRVRRRGDRLTRKALIGAAVLLGMVLLLAGLGLNGGGFGPVDMAGHPIAWLAVAVGVGWSLMELRTRSLTSHNLWWAIALTAVGLAPLGWLEAFDGHPLNADGASVGIATFVVLVVGVNSHRALVRELGRHGSDEA